MSSNRSLVHQPVASNKEIHKPHKDVLGSFRPPTQVTITANFLRPTTHWIYPAAEMTKEDRKSGVCGISPEKVSQAIGDEGRRKEVVQREEVVSPFLSPLVRISGGETVK
nr:hypothetical protein Iba_chr06bCG13840 [Ipomoea batatas]